MVFISFSTYILQVCVPCISSLNFLVIDPAQCSEGAENYFSSCPVSCRLEYLFGLTLQSTQWWKLLALLHVQSTEEWKVLALLHVRLHFRQFIQHQCWITESFFLACHLCGPTGTVVPTTTQLTHLHFLSRRDTGRNSSGPVLQRSGKFKAVRQNFPMKKYLTL